MKWWQPILPFAFLLLAAPAWAQLDAAAGLDSTTSACMDQSGPKPAGTPCDEICHETGTCNSNGQCIASPKSDGTPCNAAGCASSAECMTGICSCGASSSHDLGTGSGGGGNGGCSFDGAGGSGLAVLSILALGALSILGRRRGKA
jgi:hypothetical protein